MATIDFDYLNATTMTVIIPLKGKIYIDLIFPLLRITKMILPIQKRATKKFKLPYCGIPGAILSANYMGITRGIIKNTSKDYFRNSITIDISTSKKNVNAKLSSNTIQICGPDSEDLAREAANHLIRHLYEIQDELDYMNEHKDDTIKIIGWLKPKTKGKQCIVDSISHEIIDLNEGDSINEFGFLINKQRKPYLIIEKIQPVKKSRKKKNNVDEPKILMRPIKPLYVNEIIIPEEYPDKYPEDLDIRIIDFMIKYAPNFAYHNHYCQFLDDIIHIEKIIEKPIEIETILIAMVNYSYTLGMNINRASLAKNINGINGLVSSYNNSSDYSVKIELPYEPTDEMKKIRKKYKVPKHTFMVYKSGLVTQSAPNRELAKDAFYKFKSAINSIRDKIIQKGRVHNLKYTPIKYPSYITLNILNDNKTA